SCSDSRRLNVKTLISQPLTRLLQYEVLLKKMLQVTPVGHEDNTTIPLVLEVIKSIREDAHPAFVLARQKANYRHYASLICRTEQPFCSIDELDLLDDSRSLIHFGRLPTVGQNDRVFFAFLFDNYFLLTEESENTGGGSMGYCVIYQPTPLDMLVLGDFDIPPVENGVLLYPFKLYCKGQIAGSYTLHTESAQARVEWKQKLDKALCISQARDTAFVIKPLIPVVAGLKPKLARNINCSVTFASDDGRPLIAIGCDNGVWMGFVDDPRCGFPSVNNYPFVKQCLVLECFAVFLVLADGVLFAYHVELLVSAVSSTARTTPPSQRLSGNKDVNFFTVGQFHSRTLVAYMARKGQEDIWRILEPVTEKIGKASTGFSSKLLRGATKSEWFKPYGVKCQAGMSAQSDFLLPSGTFGLMFHDNNIVILCNNGFKIVSPDESIEIVHPVPRTRTSFTTIEINANDIWPRSLPNRCNSSRSMGVFKSAADEILLCYNDFGLYVDRSYTNTRPTAAVVEWENAAEGVAIHRPYILLLSKHTIEVRQLETGKLVQIIRSQGMRCIWNGHGTELGRRMGAQDPGIHMLAESSQGFEDAILGIFTVLPVV
ncbi:Dbl domain-containing protein, partial [Moniliophthora roreri]